MVGVTSWELEKQTVLELNCHAKTKKNGYRKKNTMYREGTRMKTFLRMVSNRPLISPKKSFIEPCRFHRLTFPRKKPLLVFATLARSSVPSISSKDTIIPNKGKPSCLGFLILNLRSNSFVHRKPHTHLGCLFFFVPIRNIFIKPNSKRLLSITRHKVPDGYRPWTAKRRL